MSGTNRPSFEIGLTLGGAVSAGAYTAGVVDFLIEALDAWWERKNGPDVLHHNFELKVLSGASAGAMTAAIAAVALQSSVKPAHYDQETADPADNRLYDAWVRQIDIRRLLSLDDLGDDRPVLSLFNSDDLQIIAKDALRTSAPHSQRSYVADPLFGKGLVTKSVNLAWSALLAERTSDRIMAAMKESLLNARYDL